MKEKVNLPEAHHQKQAMSLEQYLIRHCAPTLASLKTANLFSCSFTEQPDFSYCISYWNARMKDKGIKVVLLQKKMLLDLSRIRAATVNAVDAGKYIKMRKMPWQHLTDTKNVHASIRSYG